MPTQPDNPRPKVKVTLGNDCAVELALELLTAHVSGGGEVTRGDVVLVVKPS